MIDHANTKQKLSIVKKSNVRFLEDYKSKVARERYDLVRKQQIEEMMSRNKYLTASKATNVKKTIDVARKNMGIPIPHVNLLSDEILERLR